METWNALSKNAKQNFLPRENLGCHFSEDHAPDSVVQRHRFKTESEFEVYIFVKIKINTFISIRVGIESEKKTRADNPKQP